MGDTNLDPFSDALLTDLCHVEGAGGAKSNEEHDPEWLREYYRLQEEQAKQQQQAMQQKREREKPEAQETLHVKDAQPSRKRTSPQWNRCTGSFSFDTQHELTSITQRLVEFVLQCPSCNEGSQGPLYLQPGEDKVGFLQLCVQSGMKEALFYCRTVRGKKISEPQIRGLKNALGLCGAKSVEVQGKKGGEFEYALKIADCELLTSETVDLCAGSTTIPCEILTISRGLHFCDQSIQHQVEIFEVGKKANPGGLGTKKQKRGGGDGGEESDDGTSDESVENEIGVLALFERREQKRGREEAADAQHTNVEDVRMFVQGLSLDLGDQASVSLSLSLSLSVSKARCH